ncbi:hypothetical protein ACQPW1_01730 [Nocardia sp. CA-128927]|uniref:hypothetical protein n=1 Tax=Nocardia sp. CA-128927 TaxID=3239975 RepID=UPI003D97429A
MVTGPNAVTARADMPSYGGFDVKFSIQRTGLVVGLIVTAGVLSLTSTTGAGAAPVEYQPPELTFVATGPHEITATIRNPNATGICYAIIGLDTSVHEFAEHDGTGYAPAGRTIQVTRHDLPADRYRLSGYCGSSATSRDQRKAPDQEVIVPGDKPGSSGSS